MAISEFEIKRIEKLVGQFVEKRRPPAHVRNDIDISFRVSGQSFELFEIRPVWGDPSKKLEGPVAKATYVKGRKLWKLYWMKADLRWHSYEPLPASRSLEEILDVIDQDANGCFWG